MSHFADYIKEREAMDCVEWADGFATYKIIGNECYIRDIYIVPEKRSSSLATALANEIAEKARLQGCKLLTGTVDPNLESSTVSAKILLAYGMKIHSASKEKIIFYKEL